MSMRAAGADALGLIYEEAAALDDRRWDDWLALFAPDCEYWMPMWETEEALNTDPMRQLSHIYYASRAGLEDRIVRIRSGRSPASSPIARTTHMIGSALEADAASPGTAGGGLEVRATWSCHVFFPVIAKDHTFHGRSRYLLSRSKGGLKIAKKKIELMNDYIPSMLDIYCV